MGKPFPIRESSILSLAELISRCLGLLFLAKLVTGLGLADSAAFRISLPLIGIAATFGSIGLPQALTRLFAALDLAPRGPVPRSSLRTALQATVCAVGITLLALSVLLFVAASEQVGRE